MCARARPERERPARSHTSSTYKSHGCHHLFQLFSPENSESASDDDAFTDSADRSPRRDSRCGVTVAQEEARAACRRRDRRRRRSRACLAGTVRASRWLRAVPDGGAAQVGEARQPDPRLGGGGAGHLGAAERGEGRAPGRRGEPAAARMPREQPRRGAWERADKHEPPACPPSARLASYRRAATSHSPRGRCCPLRMATRRCCSRRRRGTRRWCRRCSRRAPRLRLGQRYACCGTESCLGRLVLQPRPLIPHRLPQAGLTPYLASCMHDHAATAEALLVGGAKPDAADVRACPPLVPPPALFICQPQMDGGASGGGSSNQCSQRA